MFLAINDPSLKYVYLADKNTIVIVTPVKYSNRDVERTT